MVSKLARKHIVAFIMDTANHEQRINDDIPPGDYIALKTLRDSREKEEIV
jgi:hypothetical protein